MIWSEGQVENWKRLQSAYTSDSSQVISDKELCERRSHAQREMVQCLNDFLDGAFTLREFNTIFQQKTHNAWSDFHLQGMSGGLFLNKLVKYVPSEETFAHLLRMMLRAPRETRDGQRQMQAFVRFLEGLIDAKQVTRSQLQPARVPFFLGMWWHVQMTEQWPIFYPAVRSTLITQESAASKIQDPVSDYFTFRSRFLSLAKELGLSAWELEYICRWAGLQNQDDSVTASKLPSLNEKSEIAHVPLQRYTCALSMRAVAKQGNTAIPAGDAKITPLEGQTIFCRTHLQWLLAKIGRKVGCHVWIAASDQNKVCQNERLGDLSLTSLPILADSTFQKIISRIDILWLQNNEVIAAYEIEQACTDVSISLLRLHDLGALFSNQKIQLCVVAPQERFEKVQFELSRPTFYRDDAHRRCALISEELLLKHEEHILRWASSPAVIQELIRNASQAG